METHTTCDKCNHHFKIKDNLKFKVTDYASITNLMDYRATRPFFDGDEVLVDANNVICPMCGNEFRSDYKLFGFLTPKILQIIGVLILSAIIVFSIYIAVRGK